MAISIPMPSNGYHDMTHLDHTGSHWIPIRINKDSQNHCLLKTLKEIGHHLLQQRSEDTHLVHPVEKKKRPLKAALVKLFEAKEVLKKYIYQTQRFTKKIWVCLKIVVPLHPMVNDHYPY